MTKPDSTRTWPLPRRPWAMTQSWHDLLFAHWEVDAGLLAATLPTGLTLDTYEGRAWLAVVPFTMTRITLRGVLPLPGASAFPELNVRTYVTAGGKPGVWFYSLDAGSPLAVEGARLLFHLPYLRAHFAIRAATGGWVEYESRRADRRGREARFRARYRPAGEVCRSEPGTLEHWLTERYCLYSADRRGRLYRGEIDHVPWPLQPAEAEIAENSMAEAAGIALPQAPPLLHFARRIDVKAWLLERA